MPDGEIARPNPWRPLFERVREAVGEQRDATGVVGSINWLRVAMEDAGANPNVVRNIIYRDKGRLPDKRALYAILGGLWQAAGNGPLRDAELELALSEGAAAEQEVLKLLGRDKRKAYRAMMDGLRAGASPKVLVTGRPGSGKTLLTDYVRQGVHAAGVPSSSCVRLEFGSLELATSLTKLAAQLGVPDGVIESKLVRIATTSPYAVQADAQAEVARVILDALRERPERLVLLLHVSRGLHTQESMALAPLRLNTPDVPRVTGPEWLWETLLEPLARLPSVALLVTMTDLPARAMQKLGQFGDPVRLTPPTTADARRFVKARAPELSPTEQSDIVSKAGRSFEELRTLTLLAQARTPELAGGTVDEAYLTRLGQLADPGGEPELRAFLAALAVLSPPDFPTFQASTLLEVGGLRRELGPFELSFLDPVPGLDGEYRSFSRQLVRELRTRFEQNDLTFYRHFQSAAATAYLDSAAADPPGDAAARYLHHLLEARDWPALTSWVEENGAPHALIRQLWKVARAEPLGRGALEAVARQVASHYVKFGAYGHPDAASAFEVCAASADGTLRAWTLVKQAEGEVLSGREGSAELLLQQSPGSTDPLVRAESALVRASIKRWRSELSRAAELVAEVAKPELRLARGSEADLARTKATVWEGLIAKDRGDLAEALAMFGSVETPDDLIMARVLFQRGDVRLKLGLYDTAAEALDGAVELAERSEAFTQELARYHARRGTAYRLMGDPERALTEFDAALDLVRSAELGPSEAEYVHARIRDESALSLLATGRYEDANLAITAALAAFKNYSATTGTDATFRVLRSTLHLAVTYACRGLGQAFRFPAPLPRHHEVLPDLQHARASFDEILARLAGAPSQLSSLRRQAVLLASRFAERAESAHELAAEALAGATTDHQRARALSLLAAAELRRGRLNEATARTDEALRALAATRGPGERGDMGLKAHLLGLNLVADVRSGDSMAAAESLATALADDELAPYHDGLLRIFGDEVDARDGARGSLSDQLGARGNGAANAWRGHELLRSLLGTAGPEEGSPARLPDVLVAAWRSRSARETAAAGKGPA